MISLIVAWSRQYWAWSVYVTYIWLLPHIEYSWEFVIFPFHHASNHWIFLKEESSKSAALARDPFSPICATISEILNWELIKWCVSNRLFICSWSHINLTVEMVSGETLAVVSLIFFDMIQSLLLVGSLGIAKWGKRDFPSVPFMAFPADGIDNGTNSTRERYVPAWGTGRFIPWWSKLGGTIRCWFAGLFENDGGCDFPRLPWAWELLFRPLKDQLWVNRQIPIRWKKRGILLSRKKKPLLHLLLEWTIPCFAPRF